MKFSKTLPVCGKREEKAMKLLLFSLTESKSLQPRGTHLHQMLCKTKAADPSHYHHSTNIYIYIVGSSLYHNPYAKSNQRKKKWAVEKDSFTKRSKEYLKRTASFWDSGAEHNCTSWMLYVFEICQHIICLFNGLVCKHHIIYKL